MLKKGRFVAGSIFENRYATSNAKMEILQCCTEQIRSREL